MARARKFNPHIPKHIDQKAIPTGLFWDSSGRGRWFKIDRSSGVARRVMGPRRNALLSELHQWMEANDEKVGTVRWVMVRFRKSSKWRELSQHSQDDYTYVENVLNKLPVKQGGVFGDLVVDRLTPVNVQAIVERVANQGHPTKANKILRYLRRLFRWGKNHVGLRHNPAEGVEQVRERKRQRLPENDAYKAVLKYAMQRAAITPNTKGSIASYLPWFLELTYLCRLRGIETLTLTIHHATKHGVETNRRKGSRDNVVKWTPRLRKAWDGALAYRQGILEKKAKQGVVLKADPALFLNRDGRPLDKSGLDTLWQRFIHEAMDDKVITEAQRFSPHDLKRKGITDTSGTGAEKKDAAGLSEGMMKTYDKARPLVKPSAK